MFSILIMAIATLPLLLGNEAPVGVEHISPCVPDTVEVIEQQIVEPDTTATFNGIPVVTYRIILCVPEGVDLKNRER